jgi:hypothetical protein
MCGFKHVNDEPPCSDVLCPLLWKVWQLPTFGYIALSLYVDVVINFKFGGLSDEIMFTFNKQHQLLWI